MNGYYLEEGTEPDETIAWFCVGFGDLLQIYEAYEITDVLPNTMR